MFHHTDRRSWNGVQMQNCLRGTTPCPNLSMLWLSRRPMSQCSKMDSSISKLTQCAVCTNSTIGPCWDQPLVYSILFLSPSTQLPKGTEVHLETQLFWVTTCLTSVPKPPLWFFWSHCLPVIRHWEASPWHVFRVLLFFLNEFYCLYCCDIGVWTDRAWGVAMMRWNYRDLMKIMLERQDVRKTPCKAQSEKEKECVEMVPLRLLWKQ